MSGEITWEDVLRLLQRSPLHHECTVDDLVSWFVPPLNSGQYVAVLDHESGVLVGFATWAFVNDEVHQILLNDFRPLSAQEWTSGEHIWLMDFIAPYGHAFLIARTLRRLFAQQGFDGKVVNFKRQYVRATAGQAVAQTEGAAWRYHS